MGAKTKFKIDYTIEKKELVEKVEKQLISEGWEKQTTLIQMILNRQNQLIY